MMCEQCGKSNPDTAKTCNHCGAAMPATSACGGFADILTIDPASFAPQPPTGGESKNPEGMNDVDMQKLIKRSDRIIKTTQENRKFSLIAIGLSVLIFISSFSFGIITLNKLKKPETPTKISENSQVIQDLVDELKKALSDDELTPEERAAIVSAIEKYEAATGADKKKEAKPSAPSNPTEPATPDADNTLTPDGDDTNPQPEDEEEDGGQDLDINSLVPGGSTES